MAELKIKADTGAGTVSWKGPNATTSNAAIQLTLPVDDGAANTWLKSNGSGVTSWAAPTATEIATSSGTAGNTTFLRGDNTWAAIGATGKLLKWYYDVCEGAKTTTANGSPGDKAKGVELFTKDFACSSSTSTVIIMTNPMSFYESANGGDNFWLSAWQDTTQISAVSGTPRYEHWPNSLNAGTLGYFGRHQPGGTSTITYSIRGGMNGSSETTNIQNSSNQQSDQNTRSHMFLFEVEAN